jgi:hypothetical protein
MLSSHCGEFETLPSAAPLVDDSNQLSILARPWAGGRALRDVQPAPTMPLLPSTVRRQSICASERLRCRPHNHLVEINIGGLLDGKGDGSGNCVGVDGAFLERFDRLSCGGIGDMIV